MRLSRLLPLCAAMTGCALEPDDPIYFSGTVLEADGTPWRGGPLSLMRPRKVDAHLNEFGVEVFSTRYEPWAEVTPDAEGLFLHRLDARDVGADRLERPTPWTDETYFQLHLPRADGGRDFLWFQAMLDTDLPPLRPWDSQVRIVDEAGGVRLSWAPLQPVADIPAPNYFVRVRHEDGLAWQIRPENGAPVLTPELLEDFTDHAHVQAVSKGAREWFTNTLFYNAVSESPPVPLPFAGRVPVSRGAGCALESGPFEPCPLTDGRLTRALMGTRQSALSEELFLLLKEPVRPRRAILRGLEAYGRVLHVEGSVDGKTWLPLGDSAPLSVDLNVSPYDDDTAQRSDQERFVDVPLMPDAPAVSHIRLRMTDVYSNGESGVGQFRSLREVSIFGD
ncbi:hypothetical protein ACLESD_27670 [Pyxidicoccus sp. 3LFB2]